MLRYGYLVARLILLAVLFCALTAPAADAIPWEVKTVLTLDGEAAGDRFGDSVCPAGDVNDDGFMDFLVSAYLNDAGGADAGRAYLYLGGSTIDSTPDLVLTGENPGDKFGRYSAFVGDVNADGVDDFIVNAHGFAGIRGRVYLYLGGSSIDGIPDLIFDGEVTHGQFSGHSPVGDVNADGYDDFLISAGWYGGGRVYVYFGGPDLDNIADMVIIGPSGGEFGICLLIINGGDFNDDGYNDIFIGAYKSDLSGFDSGGAWLYHGGPGLDAIPDLVFAPESSLEWFGGGINGFVGDVNGDNNNDFMVSARAPYKSNCPGKLYIYLGEPAIDTVADYIFYGEAGGDCYGNVAGIGDINQDGFDDFIVGAYRNDDAGSNAGKAYIYLGATTITNTPASTLTGEEAGEWFGTWIAPVGDLNGDGIAEFAIAAEGNDSYATDAGRVYVYTVNPGFTPRGSNVIVQPVDSASGTDPVTVTYDSVTVAGVTSLTITDKGPKPPTGFKMCSPSVFYQVTTSAVYMDSIEICIDYTGLDCGLEKKMELEHYENGKWVPCTTFHDPVADIICGRVASLSTFAVMASVDITFDIKPRSCPNPFNLNWLKNKDKGNDNEHAKSKKGGVLPAALVGSDDFDVYDVDISTLRLEGIAPLRTSYEDVSRPVDVQEECACTTGGPDGIIDLTMKFSRMDVAELLETAEHGDIVKLVLSGAYLDGTLFEASDCIAILSKHPEPEMEETDQDDQVLLGQAVPNPFNPSTRIGFYLPGERSVTLEIFDSAGRSVARILEGDRMPRGSHTVEWRGIDNRGNTVASGLYFYRLRTEDATISRKMILLR